MVDIQSGTAVIGEDKIEERKKKKKDRNHRGKI